MTRLSFHSSEIVAHHPHGVGPAGREQPLGVTQPAALNWQLGHSKSAMPSVPRRGQDEPTLLEVPPWINRRVEIYGAVRKPYSWRLVREIARVIERGNRRSVAVTAHFQEHCGAHASQFANVRTE